VLTDNVYADLRLLTYMEVLLSKIMVGMMSMSFASVQSFFMLLALWHPQLIHELLRGPLMHKDMKLSITGSLKT
jgi:hypothetical protein